MNGPVGMNPGMGRCSCCCIMRRMRRRSVRCFHRLAYARCAARHRRHPPRAQSSQGNPACKNGRRDFLLCFHPVMLLELLGVSAPSLQRAVQLGSGVMERWSTETCSETCSERSGTGLLRVCHCDLPSRTHEAAAQGHTRRRTPQRTRAPIAPPLPPHSTTPEKTSPHRIPGLKHNCARR
jgi:hypothetical protein